MRRRQGIITRTIPKRKISGAISKNRVSLTLSPKCWLVGLYEEPERPSSAMDYIKRYLGAPAGVDVDGLRKENEELKSKVEKLKRQLANEQHNNNNNKQKD